MELRSSGAHPGRNEGAFGLHAEVRGLSLVFPVALTEAAVTPVKIAYRTVDGSAKAGSDYVATSGTLTIGAGKRLGAITVRINADPTPEGKETVQLQLTTTAGAGIGDGSAVGTILDRATTGAGTP